MLRDGAMMALIYGQKVFGGKLKVKKRFPKNLNLKSNQNHTSVSADTNQKYIALPRFVNLAI